MNVSHKTNFCHFPGNSFPSVNDHLITVERKPAETNKLSLNCPKINWLKKFGKDRNEKQEKCTSPQLRISIFRRIEPPGYPNLQ